MGLEAGVNKPTTVEEWVAMPHPEDIERMKELRDWQDLTDEELHEAAKDYEPFSVGEWNMMRLVEKALREKNVRD